MIALRPPSVHPLISDEVRAEHAYEMDRGPRAEARIAAAAAWHRLGWNLAVAGALCAGFELGQDFQRYMEGRWDGPAWEPGCNLPRERGSFFVARSLLARTS